MQDSPLLTFQSANDEVNDVQWSPNSSTIFSAATSGGAVEIWDMSISTLRPVASHTVAGARMSCVLFAEDSPVVVAAGSTGSVAVLRLHNAVGLHDTLDQQNARLEQALDANIVKTKLAGTK